MLDLSRIGAGRAAERFEALAALGEADPVLARLGEAHADAQEILHEITGQRPSADGLWGVWAWRSCRVPG